MSEQGAPAVETCGDQHPTLDKQCTLPKGHHAHRNVGDAWYPDLEAIDAELADKDAKIERLRERVAELSKWEVGVKNLTAADGSIDMSLAMAHDMMRIYVSAFTEILDEQGGPNYVEMMFKLAGTLDTYTVTIRRPKGKTPGEVASEQRQRAESAEAERDGLIELLRDIDSVLVDLRAHTDPSWTEPALNQAITRLRAALGQPVDPPGRPPT